MFKDELELFHEIKDALLRIFRRSHQYFVFYRHKLINYFDPMPKIRGGESTINYLMRIDPKYSLRFIDYELYRGQLFNLEFLQEIYKIANKKNRELINGLRRDIYHAKYLERLKALRGLIDQSPSYDQEFF